MSIQKERFEIFQGGQVTQDLGTYDSKTKFRLINKSPREDIQYYLAKNPQEYVTDKRTLRRMEQAVFNWEDTPDAKFLIMINNSGSSVSVELETETDK